MIDANMDHAMLRIGIVAAEWNDFIVQPLIDGTVSTLRADGVPADRIHLVRCPGSYEIPVIAKTMATTGTFDAIIALGVVIRGETAHFEYVSGPVAYGLQQIAIETGVPCMFGVLTVETIEQAQDRAGGNFGNKGIEAAKAALRTIEAVRTARQ